MRSMTKWISSLFILVALPLAAGEFEEKIEKEFIVKPGGLLTVKADLGSIQINTVSANKVKAEVLFKSRRGSKETFLEKIKELDVEFEKTGNDVTITADCHEKDNFWNNFGKYVNVKFIIEVPEKYNVDLKTSGGSISVDDLEGKIVAHTSGGSLHFGNTTGSVKGKTSGGSINLDGCQGDVDVNTSGGSIRIGKVQGIVNAHTSGGQISVEEVMGTIDAGTSGGSIHASITKQPENDCKLTTSGGSITVALSENIKVNLNASTSGGNVKTDFPVMVKGVISKHKLNAKINGGGPELYLRTSGGSIYIEEL